MTILPASQFQGPIRLRRQCCVSSAVPLTHVPTAESVCRSRLLIPPRTSQLPGHARSRPCRRSQRVRWPATERTRHPMLLGANRSGPLIRMNDPDVAAFVQRLDPLLSESRCCFVPVAVGVDPAVLAPDGIHRGFRGGVVSTAIHSLGFVDPHGVQIEPGYQFSCCSRGMSVLTARCVVEVKSDQVGIRVEVG